MSRGPTDLWRGFEANRRFDASCRSACRVIRPCRKGFFSVLKLCSLSSLFLQSVFQNSFAIKEMRTLSKNNRVYAISFQFETRRSGRPRSLSFAGVCEPAGGFPSLSVQVSTVNRFSEPPHLPPTPGVLESQWKPHDT